MTSLQRAQYGKGRKSNLIMEKADKHYLRQVIKVKSTVISYVDGMYL